MPRIIATFPPTVPPPRPPPAVLLRRGAGAEFAGAANIARDGSPVGAVSGAAAPSPPLPRDPVGGFRGAWQWVRNALAAARPSCLFPYERALATWARAGTVFELRAEAVARIRDFLESDTQSTLDLAGLGLVELPPLPQPLLGLDCTSNQLRRLPALCDSMRVLVVSGNPLDAWPDLPPRLLSLELIGCGLTRVGPLPRTLLALDLCDNRIAELPGEWPPGLITLVAEDNRITHLPTGMERLSLLNRVLLHGNPLAPDTLQQIAQWNQQLGMDVFATAPLPSNDDLPPGLVADADRLRDLEQRDAQDPEAAFERFLARLATTINAQQQPGFAEDLVAWRQRLDQDPELRATTLAIALAATASCEDRVTLTYLEMRRAEGLFAIEKGRHDHDLPHLVALLRHAMREAALDRIAMRRIARFQEAEPPRYVDEIETILHYRIGMGALLPQAGAVRAGRFAVTTHSGVTDADLADARNALQQLDAGFPRHLSNLPLWHGVLERWNPEAVASARKQREALADPDAYMERVTAYLRAEHPGLEDDEGARASAGPEVLERMNHAMFWPLTQQLLQERGVSLE